MVRGYVLLVISIHKGSSDHVRCVDEKEWYAASGGI